MTTRALILALAAAVALSGCSRIGESRLNPFNWFGRGSEAAAAAPAEVDVDPRPLVAEITSLQIERTPTGAIVRATGLPPEQGWYGADLVPTTDGPVAGELTYTFRAVAPRERQRVSTRQSRELTVAVALSETTLAEVRSIRVLAARNGKVARR